MVNPPSNGPFIPAKTNPPLSYGVTPNGYIPNSLSAPSAPSRFIPAAQRTHAVAQNYQFYSAPQFHPAPGLALPPSDSQQFYAASWTGSQPLYPVPTSHHVPPPTARTFQPLPPRLGSPYPPRNFRPAQ